METGGKWLLLGKARPIRPISMALIMLITLKCYGKMMHLSKCDLHLAGYAKLLLDGGAPCEAWDATQPFVPIIQSGARKRSIVLWCNVRLGDILGSFSLTASGLVV